MNKPGAVIVINTETSMVQHPHPMFASWGAQIEWYVNKYMPDVGSYVGRDGAGTVFCGRVGDANKPRAEVLVIEPLRVVMA